MRNDTVRWTVFSTCYLFTESIRKLLRWSSGGSACVSGMREGGREKGERERGRVQLQPLSSAAWLVAIATWLGIPFHLPFLINSYSCLSLANLLLSWNALPLRLTSLPCFREDRGWLESSFRSEGSLFVATPLWPCSWFISSQGYRNHIENWQPNQTFIKVIGHPSRSGELEKEWEKCAARRQMQPIMCHTYPLWCIWTMRMCHSFHNLNPVFLLGYCAN